MPAHSGPSAVVTGQVAMSLEGPPHDCLSIDGLWAGGDGCRCPSASVERGSLSSGSPRVSVFLWQSLIMRVSVSFPHVSKAGPLPLRLYLSGPFSVGLCLGVSPPLCFCAFGALGLSAGLQVPGICSCLVALCLSPAFRVSPPPCLCLSPCESPCLSLRASVPVLSYPLLLS